MDTYDAYLFDWDGTLSHSLDIWLDATHDVLCSYGIELSRSEIGPRLGVWETMLAGVPAEKFEEAKAGIVAIAHPQAAQAPLYPGAEAMLQRLKGQNKQLALITASGREIIDMVLAHHNLLDFFNLVITSDDVKANKPDPEGILFVLESFGVEKQKAVMLGDSDKDLGAAKNAGIDSILFYPESHQIVHERAFLESFGPACTITDWSEL